MKPLKLAMLGMVEGNGHPYSWSAIINGRFDSQEMRKSGYPVISEYLEAEPGENLGIPGAEVTHIWTDNPADARHVAKAAFIPHIVDDPTEVIGEVDAVVIATDRGDEHVDRARPFVDAGLPVFVDKPMVDKAEDLVTFVSWVKGGKRILSSSAMRYAAELADLHMDSGSSRARVNGASSREAVEEEGDGAATTNARAALGELRFVSNTTMKTWERYGIHALEMIYPILGPGFLTVRNTGTADRNVVHLTHASGVDCVLAAIGDMYGAFGRVFLAGTKGSAYRQFGDTFTAFKAQLAAFVDYLKTGNAPFPFEDTVELMKIIIAGIQSREAGGEAVDLNRIATG